jgi:hypothetical protein
LMFTAVRDYPPVFADRPGRRRRRLPDLRGAGERFTRRFALYPSAAALRQTLLISPPRNLFPLRAAERVTLLAAGIGITPLYARMALRLAEGVLTLHYYLKNRAQGRLSGESLQRRFRAEAQDSLFCEGDSARQHLAAALNKTHTGYPIYLCGPEGFYGRRAPGRHGTGLGGNADP